MATVRTRTCVALLVTATAFACKAASDSSDGKGTETTTDTDTDTGGQVILGDDTIDGSGTNGSESLEGGEIDMVVSSAGTLALDPGLELTSVGQMAADGDASTPQLESLQYRISSIEICENIETNGTGFGNTKNCVSIYSKGQGEDYASFGYDEAKADTENYIDLLDTEQIKKLSAKLQLTDKHVGEYNFGLVNWFQPFKVKGAVRLNDGTNAPEDPFNGTTLYTKDAPIVVETTGVDDFQKHVSHPDNITTGPAELAIQRHNNGGAWFKFAKPFVITKDDIEAKKDFKLDLVFNADGIVKGSSDPKGGMVGTAGAWADYEDGDPVYSIDVPMIGLTPIAHKKDEKVVKEKYLLHYAESYTDSITMKPVDQAFDIRIELYSLKGDAEKNVYGADVEVMVTKDTQGTIGGIYDPFFVKQEGDGEIVLEDYQHGSAFKGLKRLAAPGDTGTMKILSGTPGDGGYCLPADMGNQGCSKTVREVTVSYELVGIYELP